MSKEKTMKQEEAIDTILLEETIDEIINADDFKFISKSAYALQSMIADLSYMVYDVGEDLKEEQENLSVALALYQEALELLEKADARVSVTSKQVIKKTKELHNG